MVPVVQEVPQHHRRGDRAAPGADVGHAMAEQEAVELAERRQGCEGEGDVAGQHRQAGHGVFALVANRHQRVGGQLCARQRLLVGIAQIAEGPLGHLSQGGVLGDHRDARGERDVVALDSRRPALSVPLLVGGSDTPADRVGESELGREGAGDLCVRADHVVDVAAA